MPEASPPPQKKSVLVPVGIGFLAAGVVVPRPLATFAAGLPEGPMRALAFLSTDLFRLGFFVGLALVVIGALRNRKKA